MNKLIVESAKIAGKTAITVGAYCAGAIVGTVGGFFVGNKVIEGTANAVTFVSRKISERRGKVAAPKAVTSTKTKAKPVLSMSKATAPKKSSKPKAKSKKKITQKVVEALSTEA